MMKRMKYLVIVLTAMVMFSCGEVAEDKDADVDGTNSNGNGTDSVVNPVGPFSTVFEAFFDPAKIHDLKIVISQVEWTAMTNDMWKSSYEWWLGRDSANDVTTYRFNTEIYRKAVYIDQDLGTTFSNIGFRVRGNTTRYVPEDKDGSFEWVHWKISFSQDFEEDESVYGSPSIATVDKTNSFDKHLYECRGLVLKYNEGDPAFVKEPYSYSLFKQYGIAAPRFTFAKLTIEIEGYTTINYGVFQVYEPVDRKFVKRRFGKSSYCFKCLYTDDGPADLKNSGASEGSWSKINAINIEKTDPTNSAEAAGWTNDPWYDGGGSAYGEPAPFRPRYDIKAMKDSLLSGRELLNTFIQQINTLTGTDFENYVDNNFDVEIFLKAEAVTVLLGMDDDYWGNMNNYYLVYSPTNQKWVYIPYDFDSSFDMAAASKSVINWGNPNAVLMEKMMARTKYKDMYKSYIRELIDSNNSYFKWSVMQAKMQSFQSVISSEAQSGTICHDNPDSYNSDLSAIQSFVNTRIGQADSEVN